MYLGNTNAQSGTLTVKNYDGSSTIIASVDLTFTGVNYFTFLTQKYLETYREMWLDYSFVSEADHPEGVTLEITLNTSVISDLVISDGGTGYSEGTLTATGGGGNGFFGTYKVSGGVITSVHIIDGGTAYTSSPTIVTSDAGNSDAVIDSYSILNCGIARGGFSKSFRNPNYGMKEGFIDYSIFKKYNSGSEYVKRRDIVRTFGGDVLVALEEVNNFSNLARQSRQYPLAWDVLDGEQRGVCFGKITKLPLNSRAFLKEMRSSIIIEEVL
jgi:hypothetical protein